MRKFFWDFVPGLVGATLAGAAGYYVVWWISQRSPWYMPVIPGAFAGLACGLLSFRGSRIRGLFCALIALTFGLLTQWQILMRQVETDGTFLDFLAHIHTESPLMLFMIALGAFLGYWWGSEATNPWRHRFASSPQD